MGGSSGDPKNDAADQDTVVLEVETQAAAGGGGIGNPPVATNAPGPEGRRGNDCLVVIYTKQPALLGRRFGLDRSPIKIGRGPENHIVLEGDGVSLEHAQLERRTGEWWIADMGSASGTYVNDERVTGDARLRNGDRINIGPTILKSVSGEYAEDLYHEEIYRLTIIDGLTQAHVKRYFLEALEKEIVRARRHIRDLCVLMVDIDHLATNEAHAHMARDHVLQEVARVIRPHVGRDQVLARYVTVSIGVASLSDTFIIGKSPWWRYEQ